MSGDSNKQRSGMAIDDKAESWTDSMEDAGQGIGQGLNKGRQAVTDIAKETTKPETWEKARDTAKAAFGIDDAEDRTQADKSEQTATEKLEDAWRDASERAKELLAKAETDEGDTGKGNEVAEKIKESWAAATDTTKELLAKAETDEGDTGKGNEVVEKIKESWSAATDKTKELLGKAETDEGDTGKGNEVAEKIKESWAAATDKTKELLAKAEKDEGDTGKGNEVAEKIKESWAAATERAKELVSSEEDEGDKQNQQGGQSIAEWAKAKVGEWTQGGDNDRNARAEPSQPEDDDNDQTLVQRVHNAAGAVVDKAARAIGVGSGDGTSDQGNDRQPE